MYNVIRDFFVNHVLHVIVERYTPTIKLDFEIITSFVALKF